MSVNEDVIYKRFKTLKGDHESVVGTTTWVLNDVKSISTISRVWLDVFTTANDDLKIALIYVLNDACQKAKKVVKELAQRVVDSFYHHLRYACTIASGDVKLKIRRVVGILFDRQVFSEREKDELNKLLDGELTCESPLGNKRVKEHVKEHVKEQVKEHVPKKKRRLEKPAPVAPTAAPGSHAFLPPAPSISPLTQVLGPSVPSHEVEDSWRRGPASLSINHAPVITNETPKIGINPHNRLFLEGRAYEVYHINNEAVIEQNGLPHRIYFAGPPRDILVDGTQRYTLAFGETRVIPIDGIPHSIRFGAPSRELYVSDFPFKGTFGGPPMVAKINGVRHEFRLLGSPPEVVIDKDPSYELNRYMNNVRVSVPAPSTTAAADKIAGLDVKSLLLKAKEAGLLVKKDVAPCVPDASRKLVANHSNRLEVGTGPQREFAPPASIKDFAMNVLATRYTQIVDELHRSRTACHHCFIFFKDTNSPAYHRHVDLHVQEVLRKKDTSKSRARDWLMPIDKWLSYDEMEEIQRDPSQEAPLPMTEVVVTPEAVSSGTNDAIASTELNKACSVCHEKFVEYYDNDEDEWRFQDCVVRNSVAVHKNCLEQLPDGSEGQAEAFAAQPLMTV